MAVPDNAFELLFIVAAVAFVAGTIVLFLRHGPPPGAARLLVDEANGMERSGIHLEITNTGGRLTAVEDVVLVSGRRTTSLRGAGTILNLPRDLLPHETIHFRVPPRDLFWALMRLRMPRPRFRVKLGLFGGAVVASHELRVPRVWHSRLAPRQRSP